MTAHWLRPLQFASSLLAVLILTGSTLWAEESYDDIDSASAYDPANIFDSRSVVGPRRKTVNASLIGTRRKGSQNIGGLRTQAFERPR